MDGGLGLQSLAGFICNRWRFLSVMSGGFDWNTHLIDVCLKWAHNSPSTHKPACLTPAIQNNALTTQSH